MTLHGVVHGIRETRGVHPALGQTVHGTGAYRLPRLTPIGQSAPEDPETAASRSDAFMSGS